jgi:hypothetical protein
MLHTLCWPFASLCHWQPCMQMGRRCSLQCQHLHGGCCSALVQDVCSCKHRPQGFSLRLIAIQLCN